MLSPYLKIQTAWTWSCPSAGHESFRDAKLPTVRNITYLRNTRSDPVLWSTLWHGCVHWVRRNGANRHAHCIASDAKSDRAIRPCLAMPPDKASGSSFLTCGRPSQCTRTNATLRSAAPEDRRECLRTAEGWISLLGRFYRATVPSPACQRNGPIFLRPLAFLSASAHFVASVGRLGRTGNQALTQMTPALT